MRRSGQSGFTVLESVIALAIAGLVLSLLWQGAGTGLRAVDAAQRTGEAVSLARSRMAALGAAPRLSPGISTGDDGHGFTWRQTVAPMATLPNGATLFEVRIDMTWHGAGQPRSLGLTTRRMVSREAAP